MPKSLPETVKAFRVRVDGVDKDLVSKFVKDYCVKWVLVFHETVTENPHFHAYVETRYTQGNFSNKIKAILNVTGSDYSNQKCDDDRKYEYLSYLFNTKKGNKSTLVSYEGFSPIDIETFRANAQKISDEFQQRMRDSKKSQYDIAMMVIERNPTAWHPSVIYDEVITALKVCKTMARPNHVRDIIATVMAYNDNKRANERIKELTLKFFVDKV